jgi:hypothetical protein
MCRVERAYCTVLCATQFELTGVVSQKNPYHRYEEINMKRISPGKAIKARCLECSGSNKEVTLCHVFGCALWQHRCGCHISSGVYKARMKASFKNHKEEHDILFVEFGIKN